MCVHAAPHLANPLSAGSVCAGRGRDGLARTRPCSFCRTRPRSGRRTRRAGGTPQREGYARDAAGSSQFGGRIRTSRPSTTKRPCPPGPARRSAVPIARPRSRRSRLSASHFCVLRHGHRAASSPERVVGLGDSDPTAAIGPLSAARAAKDGRGSSLPEGAEAVRAAAHQFDSAQTLIASQRSASISTGSRARPSGPAAMRQRPSRPNTKEPRSVSTNSLSSPLRP